jgi:hypothetical protein
MSDEEDGGQVQDTRVDWLIERVEHRPLMFKLDRINKMRIDETSTCEAGSLPSALAANRSPRAGRRGCCTAIGLPRPPPPPRRPASATAREHWAFPASE